MDFNKDRTTFLLHIKTMTLIGILTTMLSRRNLLYRKKIIGGSLLRNLWDVARDVVKSVSTMFLNKVKDLLKLGTKKALIAGKPLALKGKDLAISKAKDLVTKGKDLVDKKAQDVT